MIRIANGGGAVHAWDQTHAEAMSRLRKSSAFVLVAWPDLEGTPAEIVACAKDGGETIMREMLVQSVTHLGNAYLEEVADL